MGGMTFSTKPDLRRVHVASTALCQSGVCMTPPAPQCHLLQKGGLCTPFEIWGVKGKGHF